MGLFRKVTESRGEYQQHVATARKRTEAAADRKTGIVPEAAQREIIEDLGEAAKDVPWYGRW